MTVWWLGLFAGVYELPGGLRESLRCDCSLKLDFLSINDCIIINIIYLYFKNNGTQKCSVVWTCSIL